MKIEILYVPGCPNYEPAVEAVRRVLWAARPGEEIYAVAVESEGRAKALQFPGSPTIRVDGEDVEPGTASEAGLTCRLYENLRGIPSEQAILRAVSEAIRKEKTKCE